MGGDPDHERQDEREEQRYVEKLTRPPPHQGPLCGAGTGGDAPIQVNRDCSRLPSMTGIQMQKQAGAGNRTPDLLITSEPLCQLSYAGVLALPCRA